MGFPILSQCSGIEANCCAQNKSQEGAGNVTNPNSHQLQKRKELRGSTDKGNIGWSRGTPCKEVVLPYIGMVIVFLQQNDTKTSVYKKKINTYLSDEWCPKTLLHCRPVAATGIHTLIYV